VLAAGLVAPRIVGERRGRYAELFCHEGQQRRGRLLTRTMPLAGMPQQAELYGEAQPIGGAALGPDEHQVFGAEHVVPSHLGRRGWDGKQAGALLGGQQGAGGHAGLGWLRGRS
jgi:hypothetical protein